MPKDNENVGLPFIEPVSPSEPEGFRPHEMIRCDECLRANPPTRVACLYCSAPLPVNEVSLKLRRPTLRPVAKHELGYNVIWVPDNVPLPLKSLADAATLLKCKAESLEAILSSGEPLPVARTASAEEAKLVVERLNDLGLPTQVLGDDQLGLFPEKVVRIRSMTFAAKGTNLQPAGATESFYFPWSNFKVIVSGRLVVRRVEVKERKQRKDENELLSTSEFFADDSLIDLYADSDANTWRIPANGFDFSCLGDQKSLLAKENIVKLSRIIRTNAPQATFVERYSRLRQLLDPVWGLEQETQSGGWRRESPGKVSMVAATSESNENQFTRYSRLQFYLAMNPLNDTN